MNEALSAPPAYDSVVPELLPAGDRPLDAKEKHALGLLLSMYERNPALGDGETVARMKGRLASEAQPSCPPPDPGAGAGADPDGACTWDSDSDLRPL